MFFVAFSVNLYLGREFETSWNSAQSSCNTFGADLVDIQNLDEQNFVYSILDWNQRPDSWRFYWIGLNNLNNPNELERRVDISGASSREHYTGYSAELP